MAGRAAVAVSALISAAFFVCRWAVNAEALGARDLGLATMFAFLGAVALYAAFAAALANGVLLAIALRRRGAPRALVTALVVSLLPAVFLALRDHAGR